MKGKARSVIERLARSDVRARSVPSRRTDLGLSEGDLTAAVAGDQLVLHYQPIVDIRGGACRRVEALLRWRHPRLGELLPGDFLHLATSPALAQAIDLWVLRAALSQRLAWREEGERLGVSVNLTRLETSQVDRIVAAIHGIEYGAVAFEVRAAELQIVTTAVQLALARLAGAGAGVTIDDVTVLDAPNRTLASSVDEIKISRSLIKRVALDQRAQSDVRSLVELARDYRLGVVAVGVEDKATFKLVASLGCDMAQGYWVSRPLVPDRLRAARRWAAGLAFTGVVAFGADVSSSTLAASGSRVELALTENGLFSSACCLDVPATTDRAGLTVATKLEQVQARTGLAFVARSATRADVFIEMSLGADFARTVTSKVDSDIADLELEFGQKLDGRPSIYVFATRANFALGLQQAFGVRGPDAGVLAAANGGIALPRQGAIVINLQNTNAKDLAIVRHELTHTIVNQMIGVDGSVPTWLQEGLATLQERRGTTDELLSARSGATALAVLSAGATTLTDLEPAEHWIQRNAALGGQAYTVSAEAVRVLEQRVTHDGLLRILDHVGRGESFGAAFAAEAGESLGDFENAFPARLAASEGDARIVQERHVDGVRWSFAGFTPNKAVTISIEGASYNLQFEVVADKNGMYEAVFGATAPKGEYTLRATSSAAHATAMIKT